MRIRRSPGRKTRYQSVKQYVSRGNRAPAPAEFAQMRVKRAPSDDQNCFRLDEPENFKFISGIAIGNCADDERHAKRAGQNKSEAAIGSFGKSGDGKIDDARDGEKPEAQLRMERFVMQDGKISGGV